MIITELYDGQGLGNQLWCYVTTRVIALSKGYDFGIQSPERFKGYEFMDINFGKQVFGGNGPEGGPPLTLPRGIEHYYVERGIKHPDGSDIRTLDEKLINVPDNTKIDGYMQDGNYIEQRKNDIRTWLAVRKECECYDYSSDDICVINFRGGTYAHDKDFFLPKGYWECAVAHMRKKNPQFKFVVITDDIVTARKFFPEFDVFHFDIAKDYIIIKNAKYLIISNSSFAWFPAWLNEDLKFCIAPKYWGRYNTSDGYWSLGYNLTRGWFYQDKNGNLSDYDSCIEELDKYNKKNSKSFVIESTFDPAEKYVTKTPIDPTSLSLTKRLKLKIKQARFVFGTTRRSSSNLKGFIEGILFLGRDFALWSNKTIKRYLPTNISKSIQKTVHAISRYTKKIFVMIYIPALSQEIRENKIKKDWLSPQEIKEYRKTIKVYDVFTFFNELELLEIRLQILDPCVDYFVIVEATKTFSGDSKPLYFKENRDRFKQWKHKIINYVVNDVPGSEDSLRARLYENKHMDILDREIIANALTSNNVTKDSDHWLREFYIKENVKKALVSLQDDDMCYISDLDEIWNPELIIDYSKDDIWKPLQLCYMYYLNNRSDEEWTGWSGTIVTKYKNIRSSCLNHLRTAHKMKYQYKYLKNGGWHFTFQGGYEGAKRKIVESNHFWYKPEEVLPNLENRVLNNIDHKGRNISLWKDESNLPKYLLDNKEKYKKLFR